MGSVCGSDDPPPHEPSVKKVRRSNVKQTHDLPRLIHNNYLESPQTHVLPRLMHTNYPQSPLNQGRLVNIDVMVF